MNIIYLVIQIGLIFAKLSKTYDYTWVQVFIPTYVVIAIYLVLLIIACLMSYFEYKKWG